MTRPTHNALTQRYLDAFAAPSELTVAALRESVHDSIADTTYQGRTLSRPGLLERAQVDQLAGDLEMLYSLVTSLPDKLFGGDLGAFAATTGITPGQVQAVVRGRGSAPSRLARADIYLDETGFRVMEMNMSSALGGVDNMALNRAMLELPFIADFVAENNLGYLDTMVEVAETIFAECKVPSGTRPVVALCDWPASYETLEPQLRKNVPVFDALGIEALPCHAGQLRLEDDSIWLGDRQIDVIYRLFLMEDLLDPAGPALIEPILRAAERGNVSLFTPMDSELYSSKGALALLSDEANRHLFTEPELTSLDRFLPWTRMVRSGPVTVGGQSVLLEDYAISQQNELILKPTLLHGGLGVIPGWQTDPAEWRGMIADAMDQQFVLQKRIHPFAEPFPKADGPGVEDWVVLWGAYLGARGYSGMLLRGTSKSDAGVLNMTTGAIASCCFHELS
ncbi:MAG: hypothetical protein M3Y42_19505 [Actinomycetota bacterium]|nr:hypothetical protein [Actinomycetota bacterium]MDQ2959130.1 hypothetical protein [Actinomycetota bacterium]